MTVLNQKNLKPEISTFRLSNTEKTVVVITLTLQNTVCTYNVWYPDSNCVEGDKPRLVLIE